MKDLIVAGNGPSLKNIDYQRLPRDYEVFRCNQFYLEDKYYLGKDVKIAFFNQSFFLEQIYTAKTLIKNKEYKIDNFVCSNFKLHSIYENHLNFIKYFDIFFPDANLGSNFLEKLKEFNAYICYNELYEDKRITSGIYMCAVAVALGHKRIYLSGIDFYEGDIDFSTGKNVYVYNANKQNYNKLIGENKIPFYFHSKDTDLKALEFLAKTYDISFFSLNPESILAKNFGLAPVDNNSFILLKKTQNILDDILIPKETPFIKLYYDKVLQTKSPGQLEIKKRNKINIFPNVKNNFNQCSAKERIQNHLCYKLGNILIDLRNLSDYIKLPFVLSYIVYRHLKDQRRYKKRIKQSPSLKLPPLESYRDYKEALKIKRTLAYNLGSNLIKHPFTSLFKIKKIKKEWKE